MRKIFACVALMSLGACATPSNGYYDANGNWIPYNRYNEEAHEHSPLPGGTRDYSYRHDDYDHEYPAQSYNRYDHDNGYYATGNNSLNIPPNMLPPQGMCRVWFTDRPYADEPPLESCDGIQSRVPARAYVVYGG